MTNDDRSTPDGRRPARRRRRAMLLAGLVPLMATVPVGRISAAPAAAPITVFAAASLTDALKMIAQLWAGRNHPLPRLSFASSATLAQQAAEGAPADLFVSADEKWMDWLAARRPLRPGSRTDLLGNTLVLVERSDAMKPVTIDPKLDLPGLLGPQGRLAVGDPASVPAGIYARQALSKLGLWSAVAGRLAPADSVRAALLLVERGEAPAGIVYGSDVTVAPSLSVAGTFPENSHPPIRYPAALLSASPDAASFLAFLHGDAARAVFQHDGFSIPGG